MSGIFANWKTSVLGLFVGILVVATQAYTPGMTWKTWALAAGIAAWGLLSKDFNVTGGTVPATPGAAARVASETK